MGNQDAEWNEHGQFDVSSQVSIHTSLVARVQQIQAGKFSAALQVALATQQ